LAKAGTIRPITEIAPEVGQSRPARTKAASTSYPSDRIHLIPRTAKLNIADPKIEAIVTELRKLRVDGFPHSISVLFRVFFELSTDHYLGANGVPVFIKDPNRGDIPKTLDKKVNEAIDLLIAAGAGKKDLDAVRRAVRDKQSPLYIHLMHGYVHNRFVIPKIRDLLASWDEAKPYFERIWA
jgi:hypothetical protein